MDVRSTLKPGTKLPVSVTGSGSYRRHPSTTVAVFLEPGARHQITWTMNTDGSASDRPVVVRVSAGVHPANESLVAPAC